MAKLIGLIACVASFIGASVADELASTFDPKQSSATDMVIKMLEDAKDKVTTEGEMEKNTFEKFDAWCTLTKEEKTTDINSETATVAETTASINKGKSDNVLANADRTTMITSIEEYQKDMKDALAAQKQDLETYKSTDSELVAAIAALSKAVEEMKAQQTSSAAFIQIKHTVRRAVLLADSLGFKNAQAAANGLNSEDFNYDNIIDTLEGLHEDFRKRKNEADEEQVSKTGISKRAIQAFRIAIAAEKKDKDDKEQDIATTTKELAENKKALAETEVNLEEDQAYLAETTEICATKTRVYTQRQAMREEEIAAIVEATGIMKGVASRNYTVAEKSDTTLLLEVAESRVRDPSVLEEAAEEAEAIDATEDKKPMAFLQRRAQKEVRPVSIQKRDEIAALLEKTAMKVGSSGLAKLAARARGSDPFKVIKQMIVGMINKLQTQASASQSKKAYCDKSIGESEVKRNTASDHVTRVNRNLVTAQARFDQQTEDIAEFVKTLDSLETQKTEADEIRADEARESSETITEAEEAVSATKAALQVLNAFYKNATGATVPKASLMAQPSKDAPKDEAYTGDQAGSKGIVGMLEVIKSNFERTVRETEASEKEEIAKYRELKSDMSSEKSKKEEAKKVTEGLKSDTADEIETLKTRMTNEIASLKAGLLELAALDVECGHGASFEKRKAAREEEITTLKECIEIFDEMFASDELR